VATTGQARTNRCDTTSLEPVVFYAKDKMRLSVKNVASRKILSSWPNKPQAYARDVHSLGMSDQTGKQNIISNGMKLEPLTLPSNAQVGCHQWHDWSTSSNSSFGAHTLTIMLSSIGSVGCVNCVGVT